MSYIVKDKNNKYIEKYLHYCVTLTSNINKAFQFKSKKNALFITADNKFKIIKVNK